MGEALASEYFFGSDYNTMNLQKTEQARKKLRVDANRRKQMAKNELGGFLTETKVIQE